MGDHFVLLVDRLLTESTLEAAIESENRSHIHLASRNEDMVTDFSSRKMDLDIESSPKKLVECRICHDEDEDSNMETPCACCGSLKYAHRKCVQRWCNEKGNTICEICLQPFKPGYTSPSPLFHYGGVPMNFRGNWEISRRDLYNLQLSAINHDSFEHNFEEYNIAPSSTSLLCCRILAIIFMVLLVMRHTLPVIVNGTGEYSVTSFTLLMLRFIGILLPIYIMVRAYNAVQRRRHQQDHRDAMSGEENELQQMQQQQHPRPYFIHLH